MLTKYTITKVDLVTKTVTIDHQVRFHKIIRNIKYDNLLQTDAFFSQAFYFLKTAKWVKWVAINPTTVAQIKNICIGNP